MLWGILAAPNSTRRLRGASLTAVQVALLGSGAVALIAAGSTVPGIVFAVVVVVNAALLELSEGHH